MSDAIQALREAHDKLAEFGLWALEELRLDNIGLNLDGGCAQEKAEALGLLHNVTAEGPCGDNCSCAEYGDFPQPCLRYAFDLAAYEQRAASPERDERAAFEAWCAANGHGTIDDMMMPLDRSLRALLWSVWQARASASPEHSAEPVAWRVRMQGTDGDGWMLAGKRALLQFIGEPEPLYTAPPKDQP